MLLHQPFVSVSWLLFLRVALSSLGRHIQRIKIVTSIVRMTGGRTETPLACASAPIPKGRIAAPPPLNATANPMAGT